MGVRRVQIYHLKWVEKTHGKLCKFPLQAFVCSYDVLIRSCLFLVAPEMLKICLYMLILNPFNVYDLFYYQVLYRGTSILEANIQIEIKQRLS